MLQLTSGTINASIFMILIFVQEHFKLNIIMGQNTLPISISVLAIFGIYLGFLQFLLSSYDRANFLGRNKLVYLLNNNFFYCFTQTKVFVCILLLFICSSIILLTNKNDVIIFTYIWQDSFVIIILTYIFLLEVSLKIIYILFLVKGKEDYGMEFIIEQSVRDQYNSLSRKILNSNFNSKECKNFLDLLKQDLEKSPQDAEAILNNLPVSEFDYSKLENYKSLGENYEALEDFWKQKWQVIDLYKDNISNSTYTKLLKRDTDIVAKLLVKNNIIFSTSIFTFFAKLLVEKYSDKNLYSLIEVLENESNFDKIINDKILKIFIKEAICKYIESNMNFTINFKKDIKFRKLFSESLFDIIQEYPNYIDGKMDKSVKILIKQIPTVYILSIWFTTWSNNKSNYTWLNNVTDWYDIVSEKYIDSESEFPDSVYSILAQRAIGTRFTKKYIFNLLNEKYTQRSPSPLDILQEFILCLVLSKNFIFDNKDEKKRTIIQYISHMSVNNIILKNNIIRTKFSNYLKSIEILDNDILNFSLIGFLYVENDLFDKIKDCISRKVSDRDYLPKNIINYLLIKINEPIYEKIWSNPHVIKNAFYFINISGVTWRDYAHDTFIPIVNLNYFDLRKESFELLMTSFIEKMKNIYQVK